MRFCSRNEIKIVQVTPLMMQSNGLINSSSFSIPLKSASRTESESEASVVSETLEARPDSELTNHSLK